MEKGTVHVVEMAAEPETETEPEDVSGPLALGGCTDGSGFCQEQEGQLRRRCWKIPEEMTTGFKL